MATVQQAKGPEITIVPQVLYCLTDRSPVIDHQLKKLVTELQCEIPWYFGFRRDQAARARPRGCAAKAVIGIA